eukprot:SAG11_NODE_2602_length_3180_cov_1.885427_2_plen_518_part_00
MAVALAAVPLLQLTAVLLLLQLSSCACFIAGDLVGQAATIAGPRAVAAPVRINPLRGIPQLPKVHYSWTLPPPGTSVPNYWANISVADGLLVDYARVTGSLSIQIKSNEWNQTYTTVLVQACDAATRLSSPSREVTIGVNYSPWQHIYPSKSDPRDTSKEAVEYSRLSTNVRRFLAYLEQANGELGTSVKVGLVMLDSEIFSWNESSSTDWKIALARKHELAYNWTQELFPAGTRVVYFAYGMSFWRPSRAPASTTSCFSLSQPPKRGYCTSNAFTYQESFGKHTSFAVSLYEPGEPQLERDQFNATVSAARAHGVTTVVPYIALGCGWVSPGFEFDNHGTMAHHGSFASFLDYDLRYSAQLGAQVNRPEYGSSDFGEWAAADLAVFYPSPVDTRGKASSSTPGSTHFMDHFLAYVRAGAGVDEASESSSGGNATTSAAATAPQRNDTMLPVASLVATLAAPPTVAWWVASPLEHVAAESPTGDLLQIDLAAQRGEMESAQVVVRPSLPSRWMLWSA